MNNQSTRETFESLWEYCTSNNRVCPQYKVWQEVFKILKNTEKLNGHGGEREPADPYIIYHNWEHIMPIELQFQFQRYIEWAEDHKQLDEIGKYLRSLKEEDWAHYGEI